MNFPSTFQRGSVTCVQFPDGRPSFPVGEFVVSTLLFDTVSICRTLILLDPLVF